MSTPESFSLITSGSAFDSILAEAPPSAGLLEAVPTSRVTALTLEQQRDIAVIAEDIVLFGATNFLEILQANNISQAQFTALVEPNPVFRAATALITAQLAEDPHIAERRKAKKMFSENMHVLTNMAGSVTAESKDVINAMKLLADIADLGPRKQKEDKSDGGPVVNINFGPTLGAKLKHAMVIDA